MQIGCYQCDARIYCLRLQGRRRRFRHYVLPTLVLGYKTARCHIREDSNLHSVHRHDLKYRVRINYRRILQNHIFTNTEQKYMMLLPFESPTTSKDTTRIARAHQHRNREQDMLERVWREWEYRLDICRVTRGAHIECT